MAKPDSIELSEISLGESTDTEAWAAPRVVQPATDQKQRRRLNPKQSYFLRNTSGDQQLKKKSKIRRDDLNRHSTAMLGSTVQEIKAVVDWCNANIKARSTCNGFVPRKGQIKATQEDIDGHDGMLRLPENDLECRYLKCQCGREYYRHVEKPLPGSLFDESLEWTVRGSTLAQPTNALGLLDFHRSHEAPFLRVSSETAPATLVSFLKDRLNLPLPQLLISVTGGAESFELNPRLESVIKRGLVKASEATDAWIITGGTHCGIMKYVGEAFHGNDENYVPIIGFASWGIVHNRDSLVLDGTLDNVSKAIGNTIRLENSDNQEINKETVTALLRKQYKSSTPRSLDHNHTHFFLVDNGTERFGAEIELRAQFEREVTRQYYEGSKFAEMDADRTIYSLLLVVEGGEGTLNQAYQAVQNNTPVVVVDGSGRIANLLAFAWRFLHADSVTSTVYSGRELRRKVQTVFPAFDPDHLSHITKRILDTVMVKNKITVYSLSEDGKEHDIDEALLSGIMSRMDLNGRSGQEIALLQLAMRWNRIDIASKQLDLLDKNRYRNDIHGMLLWALKENKSEFVEVLVPQVNISTFLYTVPDNAENQTRLELLYEDAMRTDKIKYFNRLMEWTQNETTFYNRLSCYSSEPRTELMDHVDHLILSLIFQNDPPSPYQRHLYCDDVSAFHDLMTWCCMMNHFKMSRYFWQQGGYSIPNALVASRLFLAMSRHRSLTGLGQFQEARDKMVRMSKKFEVLAKGVLDTCMRHNTWKAVEILRVPLDDIRLLKRKRGKSLDCIQLAVSSENREFLSHPAVQAVLDDEWHGDLSPSTTNFKIIFNLICNAPFIFMPLTLLLQFSLFHVRLRDEKGGMIRARDPLESDRPIKVFDRLNAFMGAPVTKFWLKVISFLLFLGLYTAVTLIPLTDSFSTIESILAIWFFTLIIEEVRQVYVSGRQTYWGDFWNKWDTFMYVTYIGVIIGRVVSLNEPNFYNLRIAKLLYIINLSEVYCRTLHIYEVNPVMGPKLIIIFRMLSDLLTFGALLIVFLVQYGVAAQALLFPELDPSWRTVGRVFYRPYFQLYGELLLDDMEAETECIGSQPFENCGESFGWVVTFFLGIYLIVANIMLLNLLIAMFTRTYEEVQVEAHKLWRFQWYKLLNEYQTQPYLPPPLIVLSHLRRAFRWCIRQKKPTGVEPLTERKRRALERFQERYTEFFLRNQESERTSSDSHRIARLDSEVIRLNVSLFEMKRLADQLRRLGEKQDYRLEMLSRHAGLGDADDGHSFSNWSATAVIPPHITEEMTKHILTYNVHTMASLTYPPSPDRAIIPTIPDNYWSRWQSAPATYGAEISWYIDTDNERNITFDDKFVVCWSWQVKAWKEGTMIESRTAQKKLVRRVIVPLNKISWDEPFEYEPLYYTSPYAIFYSREGPCPKTKACEEKGCGWHQWADSETNPQYAWNEQDGNINRISYMGEYKLDGNGLPINPVGRTGMAGRGVLGKWGPNHAADPILTRWKRSPAGIIVERDGKKVLEFVAIRRKAGSQKWALPGGFISDGHGVTKTLTKEFGEEALDSMNLTEASKQAMKEDLDKLFSNGVEVYKGYSDDPRNTDNAWVETTARNFHDQDGNIVQAFKLKAGDDAGDVSWVMVHRDLDLFANHVEILQRVADHHKAYW